MSYRTNKTWLYSLFGRYIHLWQWTDNAGTDTVDGYRVKLPNEYYGKQIIYPNEDIVDGLRIEYTSSDNCFVTEAYETSGLVNSGTGISFNAGGYISDVNYDGGSGQTATTEANQEAFKGFKKGDKILVQGSASNDGEYVLRLDATADGSTIYTSYELTHTLTNESAGELITITQIPKVTGGVLTFNDTTPGSSSTVGISGSWQDNQTHSSVFQTSTTGSGHGLEVKIVTNSDANNIHSTEILNAGFDYAVGDLVTFTDPGSSSETVVYKVKTISGQSGADESSHVNLNRKLSLAIVDYVKAQVKESQGDLQGKEYCMREFWKKVGDNESNKRRVSMQFPSSTYAVK